MVVIAILPKGKCEGWDERPTVVSGPHCSLTGTLLEIPIYYVWKKPSAMPRASNFAQARSFLQCREALLLLGSATSKHLSAIAVVTTGQKGWFRYWQLARSQRALTAAASGGIAWQAKLRPLRMVWTHRAGFWAPLNYRKLLRQCRDSVKICVLSSVRHSTLLSKEE